MCVWAAGWVRLEMSVQSGVPTPLSASSLGQALFAKSEKVSAELLSLTYGAVVAQVLEDCRGDVASANGVLERMGYNIGVRLVDEFLARSRIARCAGLAETAEAVAKVGFKMYLGVAAQVGRWSEDGKAFSLMLEDTPLTELVELPPAESLGGQLAYLSLVAGAVRGALEMVNLRVEVTFAQDLLLPLQGGDRVFEFRVRVLEALDDAFPKSLEEDND